MKIFLKKQFYIFSFSLLFFLIIMIFVLKNDQLGIDNYGYSLISRYLISNNVTPFIKIITSFGGGFCLLFIIAISFFIIKKRPLFYGIVANFSLSLTLNLLLKELLKRNRPIAHQLISEIGYSFPSGHAMISMAFYGFFIYLIYVYWHKRWYKWPLIIFLSLVIFTIGLSRVYLGVHYLSDVLAGFSFSLAYLIIFVYCFNLYLKKTKK